MAAREALVFIVSSVEQTWKIPVAYYFINGLNAVEKKGIVESVLIALQEIEVQVIGLTFDGTSTNISMANSFGCNLAVNAKPLLTSFQHPTSEHHVYVILDPCHMLKLIRNMLASQECLTTLNGDVKWEFITRLYEVQNTSGTVLAKNLTARHVFYQPENEGYSCGTGQKPVGSECIRVFSKRCRNDLSLFNDLFDLMNSKTDLVKHFKQPKL